MITIEDLKTLHGLYRAAYDSGLVGLRRDIVHVEPVWFADNCCESEVTVIATEGRIELHAVIEGTDFMALILGGKRS